VTSVISGSGSDAVLKQVDPLVHANEEEAHRADSQVQRQRQR